MSLVQELKHRHVFRVGAAYCGLGWVVLQFAHIALPYVGFPGWVMSTLLFLGVLGFPFVLCFAWAYEFTSTGIKRRGHVQAGESLVQETRATLNKVITAFLLLALLLVVAENFFPLLN